MAIRPWDPHGAPIPTKDGEIESQPFHTLWDAEGGQSVKVGRVSDRSPEVLRYLGSIGIFPDSKISVIRRAPFNGPIHVEIGDTEHTLSAELAKQIFVVPE